MRISEDQKQLYAEMILLKTLDLGPEGGGQEIPRELPRELAPLQPLLEELRYKGLIDVVVKKRGALAALRGKPKEEAYALTPAGVEHVGRLIDEAESYASDLEDLEIPEIVAYARERRLDPLRIRFLWGWYHGELDDLALFQERRSISPVERLWAYYLTSDDFWRELASDLDV